MARLGLGNRWRCLLANEICEKKAKAYQENHNPSDCLVVDDVAKLKTSQILEGGQLAWASFPCQDLSLAGNGRGLTGERSGTFWPFWKLITAVAEEGRPVPIIVLENVTGALTSNSGRDFATIFDVLVKKGYFVGPIVVNAAHFAPQSRPRLFIIATLHERSHWSHLTGEPNSIWHPKQVTAAFDRLPANLRKDWVWWSLPQPPALKRSLADIIEMEPKGVCWHSDKETKRLLSMMSGANLGKVKEAQSSKKMVVGTVYKRTRKLENGSRAQRAEVRFDQISGCLRTPVGGSSRQIVMIVKGRQIRSRLLSPREGARLMGLDDSYKLPERYNEAYHLVGDGLVVPVVSWLEQHLLYPLASQALISQAA